MGTVRSSFPSTSAFPRFSAGQLLHHPFRGLHSVHDCYGLQTCQVAYATLYTRGFSSFVASTTAPIATGWSEPVPGRDFPRCGPAPFHGARRVEVWRGCLDAAYPLPTLSSVGASLAPSCSVSTPRSSNRTGAFRASGSWRKVHEVAHGKLRVRVVRRTRPTTSCKAASGYCWVAGQDTLCLAHSHCRSLFRAWRSTAR